MEQTHKTEALTVATPLHIMAGLLSRLLFVFFLPIGIFMLVKAAVQKIRGVEAAIESAPRMEIEPQLIGKTYFHQGHTWAMPTAAGTVTLGFDEFTQKIMGHIDEIELPKVGGFLRQGSVAWRLRHAGRVLQQRTPVEGTILEVNETMADNPSGSSQETNWLLKIQPARLKESVSNMLHGELAEKWMVTAKSQFVQKFPQSIVPVYQDGGELIDDVGDSLNDEEWESVKKEFFQ